MSADRDDARSSREFLQDQRIELYGDYLAQFDELHAALDPLLPTNDMQGKPRKDIPDPGAEAVAEARRANDALRTLDGRVDVIGGKGVTDVTLQIALTTYPVILFAEGIVSCHVDPAAERCGDPFDLRTSESDQEISFAFLNLINYRQDFLEAVRAELGTPD